MGVKNKVAKSDGEIKYSDPRMAYMSSKKELIVKESDTIKMRDIFDASKITDSNSFAVICEDQKGFYVTSKSMIDAPVLDPYRNYKRNEYELVKDEDAFKVIKNGNTYIF